jgi:signal peptidase II
VNRSLKAALLLGLSASLVGCDHATKAAASAMLPRTGGVGVVPGVFELRYAENRDTAFSLLSTWSSDQKSLLLAVVATVMFAALAAMWWARRRGSAAEHVGFALMAGGALGNVLDRWLRGFVVDFLHLTHWPIFNVADVALVVGAAVLALAASRGGAARRGGAHEGVGQNG